MSARLRRMLAYAVAVPHFVLFGLIAGYLTYVGGNLARGELTVGVWSFLWLALCVAGAYLMLQDGVRVTRRLWGSG